MTVIQSEIALRCLGRKPSRSKTALLQATQCDFFLRCRCKFPFGGLESDPGQDPAVGLTAGSRGTPVVGEMLAAPLGRGILWPGARLFLRTASLGAKAQPPTTALIRVTQCGFDWPVGPPTMKGDRAVTLPLPPGQATV